MSCGCLDANASHKLATQIGTQQRGSAEIEAGSSNPNGNWREKRWHFPSIVEVPVNKAPNLQSAQRACPGQLPRPRHLSLLTACPIISPLWD